jgi:hypothetical protein
MKSKMNAYSLTEYHIMTVKQIAEETGLSEGQIIRNAIDWLLEEYVRAGKMAKVHLFQEPIEEEVPAIHRVSGPREFHPRALSEPDMNLSAHPAPIIQP